MGKIWLNGKLRVQLTLAMDLINIKKGDEIITPALNFGTAITSIIKANAKPIFVDIDVDTLQISIEELKKNYKKQGHY